MEENITCIYQKYTKYIEYKQHQREKNINLTKQQQTNVDKKTVVKFVKIIEKVQEIIESE